MRIKVLDDAAVLTEPPPPQHQQILDVGHVIQSVCEELQKRVSSPGPGTWTVGSDSDLVQHKGQVFGNVVQTPAALQLLLHHVSRRANRRSVRHLKTERGFIQGRILSVQQNRAHLKLPPQCVFPLHTEKPNVFRKRDGTETRRSLNSD